MQNRKIVSKALLLTIVALCAAALIALAGCGAPASSSSASASSASSSSSSGTPITAPNVVSLKRADAEKVITASGLKVGKVTEENSSSIPEGCVISQNPKAQTSVMPKSEIELVISKGPATPQNVQVPDLKGKTQADAEKALSDIKLIGVASNPEETDAVSPGQVFKQSIAAGTTVEEGTKVAFTVALAPSESTVPDVKGKSQDEAKNALAAAGLGYDHTEVYDDSVAAGVVISQSVAPGTTIRSGSTVSVEVSLGPVPPTEVSVPDVTTYTWKDAKKALASAGLDPRYSGDEHGIVYMQDIAPGTKVAEGTVVTVYLDVPTELVKTPKLIGKSAEEAREICENRGLKIKVKGSGGTHGTVQSQTPSAGEYVDAGSTVIVSLDTSEFE